MPHFQRGDLWTAFAPTNLFLITTNSTIRKDGALIMGRGIAQQARDRFPGLDVVLGKQILSLCGQKGQYGLLVSPRWPESKLGAFQVKGHYSQPASLKLIHHSTTRLCEWCTAHPDAQVVLNFPGIGNGSLCREVVLPIIAQLPKQVTVWEYLPTGKRIYRDKFLLEITGKLALVETMLESPIPALITTLLRLSGSCW